MYSYVFVGCVTHRFNLAVQNYMKYCGADLDIAMKVMTKLKNIIPSARLRNHTSLRSKRTVLLVGAQHIKCF